MKGKFLALFSFMLLALHASGQSHVQFHLTFSRFLPPWPALPHARGNYVGILGLDGDILSYYADVPNHLGGEWQIQILTPKKGPLPGLVFDLGRCQPDHQNPTKCFVSGSITLTRKQIQELLAGEWVLEANLNQSFYNPLLAHESILPDDLDGDGVPDFMDNCPDTAPGEKVNHHGCSVDQLGRPKP
jgi:hypothetical protein